MTDRRAFLRTCGVALGSIAALSLAACTPGATSTTPAPSNGGSTSTGTSGTQAPTAQTLTKVKIGVAANVFENAYTQIGIEKGFYREEGLDVEYVELADGGTILKALLAGELTHAEAGVGAFLNSIAGGAPIRLVGVVRPKLNFVLYTQNDINSPQDLVGRSIGTAAPGSFLHQIATAWLRTEGIDESQVTFVNIGSSPAVFQAVLVGKVDAGPSSVDFIPTMRESGANIKTLINFWEVLPDYLRTGVAANERDMRDRPEVLTGLLTGMAKSTRYGIEHGDEIVKFAVERYDKKPEDVQFGHDFDVANRIIAPDLDFTEQQVTYMQQLNVEAGDQAEILPFDKVATLEFQQRVIEKLGKYQWPA